MEERLHKFVRLVDAGSFTKAAERLHISQPALTTAIKKLERELHAELLVRGGHTFTLTAAGQAAYESAKELAAHTSNLKQRVSEAADGKVTLNLGMIDSVADMLFVHSNALPQLQQNTHLSLTVDNTTRLLNYIQHDDLDLALISDPGKLHHTLTYHKLGEEPLVLVTRAEHKVEVEKELQQGELYNFLGYNQHSRTYKLIKSELQEQGITLHPTFYSTSPEIMLQLLLSNRTSAVLPFLLVKPYIHNKQLAVLAAGQTPVIGRAIYCVRRNGRNTPTQANLLLDQATDKLVQLTVAASIATEA